MMTKGGDRRWDFVCPLCRSSLESGRGDTDRLNCSACGRSFRREQSIWRFLDEQQTPGLAKFVQEYETVRRGEGRAVLSREQLLSLPFCDTTGERRAEWNIRARSYRTLVAEVVEPMERRHGEGRPLRIFDLGSGNGWLAYRIALRGHTAAAIDLVVNDFDGLGIHHLYGDLFTSVQADFDHLPFRDGDADLVIFNGAFHYSTSYERTLTEAMRVLSPRGSVVVMDSPIYVDPASGRLMVGERQSAFQRRFGFRGDAMAGESFLTRARVTELSEQLDIRWTTMQPFYGLRWTLRPVVAALLGRRQPAQFSLLVAERRST
jgi:SAM-dependent methyltransferase